VNESPGQILRGNRLTEENAGGSRKRRITRPNKKEKVGGKGSKRPLEIKRELGTNSKKKKNSDIEKRGRNREVQHLGTLMLIKVKGDLKGKNIESARE